MQTAIMDVIGEVERKEKKEVESSSLLVLPATAPSSETASPGNVGSMASLSWTPGPITQAKKVRLMRKRESSTPATTDPAPSSFNEPSAPEVPLRYRQCPRPSVPSTYFPRLDRSILVVHSCMEGQQLPFLPLSPCPCTSLFTPFIRTCHFSFIPLYSAPHLLLGDNSV